MHKLSILLTAATLRSLSLPKHPHAAAMAVAIMVAGMAAAGTVVVGMAAAGMAAAGMVVAGVAADTAMAATVAADADGFWGPMAGIG